MTTEERNLLRRYTNMTEHDIEKSEGRIYYTEAEANEDGYNWNDLEAIGPYRVDWYL